MLEPLGWDDEEGPTKETALPAPSRRSRPSAGGLRVVSSATSLPSQAQLDDAQLTEREPAPPTVSSPPLGSVFPEPLPPPVIEVLEAEEVTIPADGLFDLDGVTLNALAEHFPRYSASHEPAYDSDAPASAIRPVDLPAMVSLPLPLIAPEPRPTPSTYPPGPGAEPQASLSATLLAQEVIRLRRGMLLSLVVASAALTLSLILALAMLLQLVTGPTSPAPERVAPAVRGPQRI